MPENYCHNNIFFAGAKFKMIFYNAKGPSCCKEPARLWREPCRSRKKNKIFADSLQWGQAGRRLPRFETTGACLRPHCSPASRLLERWGLPLETPWPRAITAANFSWLPTLHASGCFSVCQAYPAGVQRQVAGPSAQVAARNSRMFHPSCCFLYPPGRYSSARRKTSRSVPESRSNALGSLSTSWI